MLRLILPAGFVVVPKTGPFPHGLTPTATHIGADSCWAILAQQRDGPSAGYMDCAAALPQAILLGP
jgi:hypothetical protein